MAVLEPAEEVQRLETLRAYAVLDTPAEEDLDRLARLAARIFRVPIALVSLVDEDRQFFKARVGLTESETPRDASFCQYALGSDEVLVVPDASAHPRFADSPLVTGPPNIRFYAGAPLRTPGGQRLGTFCVIDHVAREFTDNDCAVLKELAILAMDRLELRRLEDAGEGSQARFRNVARTSPDGILCIDAQGIIQYANRAAGRIFGWRPEDLSGRSFDMLIPMESRERYRRALLRVASGGQPTMVGKTVEQAGQRSDGEVFQLELSLSLWQENGQTAFGAIIRDLTQRRALEQRLFRLAHLDPLTELANREAFRERLNHLLQHEDRLTIILLDLDNFKDVNDDHGHHAGDAVLKKVAQRLRDTFAPSTLVARLGGDEFAVLVPGHLSRQALTEAAREAIQAIALPIEIGPLRAQVGASAGIALFPWHGTTSELLMANADLALYQAKKEGRNTLRFFVSALREALLQRRKMEADLHIAHQQSQFALYYQPQVDLHTRQVIGAEALLRWHHPVLGLQVPQDFLSVLEASQLASPVGAWILRTACAQAAAWRAHRPNFRMSVNLFGAQIHEGRLAKSVQEILASTGLPPEGLELEITENTIIQQSSDWLDDLRQIRHLGVGIALDDYGTGYASLSLLKRLPISKLKIDRSFVRDVVSDKEDAAVVRAILYLGRNFCMDVIAEGVETAAHEEFLRRKGCRYAQGYLYGSPRNALEFESEFLMRDVSS